MITAVSFSLNIIMLQLWLLIVFFFILKLILKVNILSFYLWKKLRDPFVHDKGEVLKFVKFKHLLWAEKYT